MFNRFFLVLYNASPLKETTLSLAFDLLLLLVQSSLNQNKECSYTAIGFIGLLFTGLMFKAMRVTYVSALIVKLETS